MAVANAKSHPISAGGRHETAIAFLTDLEEKLDVAQVQLEIYNTLVPHVNDAPAVGERIQSLSRQLFTMTDVCLLIYLAQCDAHEHYCSYINSLQFHSTFQLSSCSAYMYQSIAMKALCDQSGTKYLTKVSATVGRFLNTFTHICTQSWRKPTTRKTGQTSSWAASFHWVKDSIHLKVHSPSVGVLSYFFVFWKLIMVVRLHCNIAREVHVGKQK